MSAVVVCRRRRLTEANFQPRFSRQDKPLSEPPRCLGKIRTLLMSFLKLSRIFSEKFVCVCVCALTKGFCAGENRACGWYNREPADIFAANELLVCFF